MTEEPAGEKEPAEETEAEKTAEEGMMLFSALAAESEAVQEADSTYTDENGVIYHYYGYFAAVQLSGFLRLQEGACRKSGKYFIFT